MILSFRQDKRIRYRISIFLMLMLASYQAWANSPRTPSGISKNYSAAVRTGDAFSSVLCLQEDTKEYHISIVGQVTHDLFLGRHFSYGKYKRTGDVLTLYDEPIGLTMVVKLEKGKAVFTSGYSFLRFLDFEESIDPSPPPTFDRKYNAASAATAREQYQREHPVKLSVMYGKYEDHIQTLVEIKSNGIFNLWILGCHMAIGNWTQEGNVIRLHDNMTNWDYYLIMKGDELQSMLLPGDNWGNILQYIRP